MMINMDVSMASDLGNGIFFHLTICRGAMGISGVLCVIGGEEGLLGEGDENS